MVLVNGLLQNTGKEIFRLNIISKMFRMRENRYDLLDVVMKKETFT